MSDYWYSLFYVLPDHPVCLSDLAESLDHEIDHVPAELRPEYLQHCYDTLVDMDAVHPGDSGLELTQSMLLVVARRPSKWLTLVSRIYLTRSDTIDSLNFLDCTVRRHLSNSDFQMHVNKYAKHCHVLCKCFVSYASRWD